MVDSAVDGGSGLTEEGGFGFTVTGLFVCGLIFCKDTGVVVDTGTVDVDVDLYVVLDGLTTGFMVENVAVELTGRGEVTVV